MILVAGCATPSVDAELAEIWLLRDQRDPGGGRLVELLRHADPRVRRRAADALGAIGEATAIAPLAAATKDPDPWVRSAALFALGGVRGPGQLEALVAHLRAAEPAMRFLAVTGIGRSGASAAWRRLLPLLGEPSSEVRGAAALACVRLAGDRLRDPVGAARRTPKDARGELVVALLAALRGETDVQVRWRQIYALAHLVDPLAAKALTASARSGKGRWERLFALRGLAALPADPSRRAVLQAAARGEDAELVFEAVHGLGRHPDEASGKLLARTLLTHSSAHVRGAAAAALGAWPAAFTAAPLRRALGDSSPNVRAAALQALARSLGPAARKDLVRVLDRGAQNPGAAADWRVQSGAVRGLGFLPEKIALPVLQRAFEQISDRHVRTVVLETLARFRGSHRAFALAVKLGEDPDQALRETLPTTLTALGDSAGVAALMESFRDSPGLDLAESRKLAVRAVAALGGDRPEVRAFLSEALEDPDLVVRREAARHLRALGEPVGGEEIGHPQELLTPLLGVDLPLDFLGSRPVIRIETDRGRFSIVLFTELAPIHAANLVTLVERGDYDGRIFHRVVPNFVVQGGDARGDGFGAHAWHGGQLRDEINPLPFGAGVVGMPKTEDPDTGGDQIFITTVPTPHLDGRYTAFGRVVRGMGIVESLEVGDRILHARLQPD